MAMCPAGGQGRLDGIIRRSSWDVLQILVSGESEREASTGPAILNLEAHIGRSVAGCLRRHAGLRSARISVCIGVVGIVSRALLLFATLLTAEGRLRAQLALFLGLGCKLSRTSCCLPLLWAGSTHPRPR